MKKNDQVNALFEALDAVRIFLGAAQMTRKDCYYSISLYQFSFSFSLIVVLFIAIDRLIAIASPMKYAFLEFFSFVGNNCTSDAYALLQFVSSCSFILPTSRFGPECGG